MTSQYEHDLWYEHGLKRAIQVLGGNKITSEYLATAAIEAERAWRPHGLGDKGHWQAVYHSFSHRDSLSPLLERSTTFCKYWLGLLFYSNAHHSRCQTGICASCELTCSSGYTSTGIQWCTAYPKCTHMGTIVGGYWNRGQQSWGSLSSVGDCSSWCPCQYRAWNQCTSCFQCHLY